MKTWESIKCNIEPLKKNRFTVELIGVDVPKYLFSECDIFFTDEKFLFSTSFYEHANYTFNPKFLHDITGVKIHYFGPIGDILNILYFDVKPINYEKRLSYRSNDILVSYLTFLIKEETMALLYKNIVH